MSHPDITSLLDEARSGDGPAAERLFAVVYDELKKIAGAQRRRWQGNETLNTTALLNEAFIKLAGRDTAYANRTHFFATASKAMRHVLVSYAEQQSASKRGGDAVRVPLTEAHLDTGATAEELLTLDALMKGLDADHPRRARIVECRVFGGMNIEETADALGISPATVKREWRISSAWLYRALNEPGSVDAP